MIKSFNIKPHSSCLYFKDYKHYPYNIFPDILFVYPYKNILLNYETLCILFSEIKDNMFVFTFNKVIEYPIQILIHNNENIINLYKKTITLIKDVLFTIFPDEISSIINSYTISDIDINDWKIEKKITRNYTTVHSFKNIIIRKPIEIFYSEISIKAREKKINNIDFAFFEKESKKLLKINRTHFNCYNKHRKKITILQNSYVVLVIYSE